MDNSMLRRHRPKSSFEKPFCRRRLFAVKSRLPMRSRARRSPVSPDRRHFPHSDNQGQAPPAPRSDRAAHLRMPAAEPYSAAGADAVRRCAGRSRQSPAACSRVSTAPHRLYKRLQDARLPPYVSGRALCAFARFCCCIWHRSRWGETRLLGQKEMGTRSPAAFHGSRDFIF